MSLLSLLRLSGCCFRSSLFVVSHAFQAALIAFGGVLTGLTTSWITVMWGYFFVSLTLPQRTLCSLGSLVVGGVLYLVILTLPEWAQMASACLLLPSSWALAIICNAGRCPSRKESADSYTRLNLKRGIACFAMFLFGIFFWICRVIKMADSAPSHLDTISFHCRVPRYIDSGRCDNRRVEKSK